MDSNITLAAIRELLVRVVDTDDADIDSVADQLNELIRLVDDLDTWLSNGGFPPTAWEHTEHAKTWYGP